MDEIDLDFDDDLEADAEAFGMVAQGDAKQQPQAPSVPQSKTGSLEEALHIAQIVYGETNSAHGEMFYRWVQVVLDGAVDVEATTEMLTLLRKDRESFGGRASWKQYMYGDTKVVERLRARRHAAMCAMNIVRAVLNKTLGRGYTLWVQRSLWRAVQAEKDVKTER